MYERCFDARCTTVGIGGMGAGLFESFWETYCWGVRESTNREKYYRRGRDVKAEIVSDSPAGFEGTARPSTIMSRIGTIYHIGIKLYSV